MMAADGGPRIKVKPELVDKFKRLPGGLNEVAIKVVRDFGLKFEYDRTKDVLELTGADFEILVIAVESLQFWIDGDVYPASGISCQVGYPNKGIVIWRFHGDYARKFDHLFEQDIAELKHIQTVNIKAVPNRKNPVHVELYCNFSVYHKVNKEVQRISEELSRLFSADFFIPKDDHVKAKQFIKSRQMDKTVLYVLKEYPEKNKVRVWIHGRENQDVTRARKEWIAHVGSIAAHSSANDPDVADHFNNLAKRRSALSKDISTFVRTEKTLSFAGSKIPEYDDPNYPRPAHMFYPISKEDVQKDQGTIKMTEHDQLSGLQEWISTSTQVSNRLSKLTQPVIPNQINLSQPRSAQSLKSISTSKSKSGNVHSISGSKITTEAVQNKVGNFHLIGGPRVTAEVYENKKPRKFQISKVRDDIPGKTMENSALPNVRYHCDINGLDIYMYHFSVVKLNGMDALVNVVDSDLKTGGLLNKAFEEAVGPVLEEERSIFLNTNGPLAVSENYVTSSGKIPCKGVIHTVGPRWQNYEEEKMQDCIRDLHTAVYKALKTAEKHQYRKVGLPAISAEPYFGVPKDVCAEMYVMGIVNYCQRMGPMYPVLEIHLVDLSLELLTCIKDAYERWEASLTPHDIVLPKDFLTVGRPLDERLTTRPAHISQNMVTFKEQTYTSEGEQMWKFEVLGRLKVNVYSGSVVYQDNVDTIVCGIDSNQNGRLAKEIWDKAGKLYQKSLENASFRRTLQEGEVLVCDAGDLPVRSVLHAVISHPVRTASSKNLGRLDHINSQIFHTINTWGMPSVAIPLLGTGRLRERFEIEQCALQLIDNVIEFVLSSGPNMKLKELHLVNSNPVMTQYILQALRTRAHTQVRLENFERSNGDALPAGKPDQGSTSNDDQIGSHMSRASDNMDAEEMHDTSNHAGLKTRRSSVRWGDVEEPESPKLNTVELEGREWVPTGRLRTGKTNSSGLTSLSDRIDFHQSEGGAYAGRGGAIGNGGGPYTGRGGHHGDMGGYNATQSDLQMDFRGSYTDRGTTGKTRFSKHSLRTSRTDPGAKSQRTLRTTSSGRAFKEIYDKQGNIIDLKPVTSDIDDDVSSDGEWSETDLVLPIDREDTTDREKLTDGNKTMAKSVVTQLEEKLDLLTQPLNFPKNRHQLYDTEGVYVTERVYKTEKVYRKDDKYAEAEKVPKPVVPEDQRKEKENSGRKRKNPKKDKTDEKEQPNKTSTKAEKKVLQTSIRINKDGAAKNKATITTTIREGATTKQTKLKPDKASSVTKVNAVNKPKIQTTIRKTIQTTIRKSDINGTGVGTVKAQVAVKA